MRKLILISFLSQLFGFIFYYLTSFIIVRIVTPEEFGLFQKFNLLLTTIVPLISLTLVSSQYYFYPIASEEKKGKVINQTFGLLTICGLLFFLGFIFSKEFILDLIQLPELAIYPAFVFLCVPLYSIASIADNLFVLDKKKMVMLLYIPLEKAFFLAAVLAFYFLTKKLESVFYAISIYSIVKVVYISFYIYKNHGFSPFRVEYSSIMSQLKYCIPFYFANVLYTISIKFDKILINRYITNEEFAYYSISFLSIPLLSNAFSSINNVTLPEITKKIQAADLDGVKTLYNSIVTKTTALTFPALVYFLINSREIIVLLFTEQYAVSTFYYRIYTLTLLVSVTSYGLILRASNRTKLIFSLNSIACLLSIGIGFLIIPVFKLNGAIITACIAIALPGMLQSIAEMRILKCKISEFFPLKKIGLVLLVSVAASPLILLLRSVLSNDLLFLTLSGIAYFMSVAFMLYKLRLLPYNDKIQELLKKLKYEYRYSKAR